MSDLQSIEGRRLLGKDNPGWVYEPVNMYNPLTYSDTDPEICVGSADLFSGYRVQTSHSVVRFNGEASLEFEDSTDFIMSNHNEGCLCRLNYKHQGDNGTPYYATETALFISRSPATYAILDHTTNVHVWVHLLSSKTFYHNFNRDGSVLFAKPEEPDDPEKQRAAPYCRPRFVDSFADDGQDEAPPNVVQRVWHEDGDIPLDVVPGSAYTFPDFGLALVLGLDRSTRIIIVAVPRAPVMINDDTVSYIDQFGYEVTRSRWPKHNDDDPETLVHGHVSCVKGDDESSLGGDNNPEWVWEAQNRGRTFSWPDGEVTELDARTDLWVSEGSRVDVHGHAHRVVQVTGEVSILGVKYKPSELGVWEGELYDVNIGDRRSIVDIGNPQSIPEKAVLLVKASDEGCMKMIFAILDEEVPLHYWRDGEGIEVYYNVNRDNSLLFGSPGNGDDWARPRLELEYFHCRQRYPGRKLKQIPWRDEATTPLDEVQPGTTHVFPEGIQLIRAVDRARRNVIVEIPPRQEGKDDHTVYWVTPGGRTVSRTRRPVVAAGESQGSYVDEESNKSYHIDAHGHVCSDITPFLQVEGKGMPLVHGCISRLRGEDRHFLIPGVEDYESYSDYDSD